MQSYRMLMKKIRCGRSFLYLQHTVVQYCGRECLMLWYSFDRGWGIHCTVYSTVSMDNSSPSVSVAPYIVALGLRFFHHERKTTLFWHFVAFDKTNIVTVLQALPADSLPILLVELFQSTTNCYAVSAQEVWSTFFAFFHHIILCRVCEQRLCESSKIEMPRGDYDSVGIG
jgi:hypothetical protein